MLGVDLEKEKVRTILDVLFDLQKGNSYEELKSMPMPRKIEYLFHSDCVYEGKNLDLISLGVKWATGCYCLPTDLLKGITRHWEWNHSCRNLAMRGVVFRDRIGGKTQRG